MNRVPRSWFGVPALAGRARCRLKPGLRTGKRFCEGLVAPMRAQNWRSGLFMNRLRQEMIAELINSAIVLTSVRGRLNTGGRS